MVPYKGVRTKNHIKPTPMTIPGNENDRKLSDSRIPDAVERILTMTYETKIDRIVPKVAPTTPRNRLFFSESKEIGSARTSPQFFQDIIEKALLLGGIE